LEGEEQGGKFENEIGELNAIRFDLTTFEVESIGGMTLLIRLTELVL
jgi:hypothetical protein